MPDSDLPRFPLNDAPSSPVQEDELATVPHSLAPLSGSNGEGSPESESAWGEVWRRRWLVAGAALVAFLSALALGRLNAARHTDVPLPTLSGASESPKLDVPATGTETEKPSPAPVQTAEPQNTPESDRAAPEMRGATPAPVAPSDALEIPPMEVPPAKGASSGKGQPRRVTPPSSTAPRKRFVPGSI
jgi:hypothetical protein